MNEKQITIIIIALCVALALGLLVTTVDAQTPLVPPDMLCSEVWWCPEPISPLSPIAPPLPPSGDGVVPVSPLVPDTPGDAPVVPPTPDEPTPTPEPTDEPSWYCWQGACYEW